jgi:hypothetical protein
VFSVEHPDNLGVLEKYACFLTEDILLIRELFWQGDRAGLPAGDGKTLRIFGKANDTGPTTLAGLADVTGYAGYF